MNQNHEEQTATEAAAPHDAGVASPGDKLKRARVARDFSLSYVSTRLKLSTKKIEALERDDITAIAAPVFVAGYIRAYARLLDLPEDGVIADFSQLPEMEPLFGASDSGSAVFEPVAGNIDGMIATALPSDSAADGAGQSKLIAVVLIALTVIAAVYFLLPGAEMAGGVQKEQTVNEAQENGETLAEVDVQETTIAPADMMISPSESVPVEIEATELSKESSKKLSSEITTVAEETPSDEGEGSAGVSDQASNSVSDQRQSELMLIFTDESWVDVADASGERLVYRLAKAGLSRTVKGVPPFDVQLGYAPGVEIFYNGQSYDMSRYAGRRSARFRVGNSNDAAASN